MLLLSLWCVLLVLSHTLQISGSRSFRKEQQHEPPQTLTRQKQQKRKDQLRRRKEICNSISYKLLFSNQLDADTYHHLYNCSSLMYIKHLREVQSEQHHRLQHVKCDPSTLGRQAAERWCQQQHASVQRVFASPTQQISWETEKCLKLEIKSGGQITDGGQKKMKEKLHAVGDGTGLKLFGLKYTQDQWCFDTNASSSLLHTQSLSSTTLPGHSADRVPPPGHGAERGSGRGGDRSSGRTTNKGDSSERWRAYQCSRVLASYASDYQVCTAGTTPTTRTSTSTSTSTSASTSIPTAPLIAIMAASTSKGANFTHTSPFQSISLFTTLLPSLLCSLDCHFRYVFVLGYDIGDTFFNSSTHMQQMEHWFEERIAYPLRRGGVVIILHAVRVDNPLKRPGPVFTAIAQAAYTLGAEYFYRVNDDSEFLGRWPALYVQQLQRLSPPYGVIGPSTLETKDRILTHDFVHRTHLDIFQGVYYPSEFSDWFMDDW